MVSPLPAPLNVSGLLTVIWEFNSKFPLAIVIVSPELALLIARLRLLVNRCAVEPLIACAESDNIEQKVSNIIIFISLGLFTIIFWVFMIYFWVHVKLFQTKQNSCFSKNSCSKKNVNSNSPY